MKKVFMDSKQRATGAAIPPLKFLKEKNPRENMGVNGNIGKKKGLPKHGKLCRAEKRGV